MTPGFQTKKFAREPVQLSTLGAAKLNVDRSFALVNGFHCFSLRNAGHFRYRGVRRNAEMQWTNWFDPVHITVNGHDRYSKSDILEMVCLIVMVFLPTRGCQLDGTRVCGQRE